MAYLGVAATAKMTFDHGIGFQDRMLVPIFPFILASGLVYIHFLYSHRGPWIKFLCLVFLVYLGVQFSTNSLNSWSKIYDQGLGWNSRELTESQALAVLPDLAADPENALFSNNSYGLYFITGEVGYRLEGFPPEGDQPSYLVIFNRNLSGENLLAERYADILSLVAEDPLVSIFRIRTD